MRSLRVICDSSLYVGDVYSNSPRVELSFDKLFNRPIM